MKYGQEIQHDLLGKIWNSVICDNRLCEMYFFNKGMRMQIKEMIKKAMKKFPTLNAIAMMILQCKNADFIEYVIGIKDNPYLIKGYPGSDKKYNGKPVCFIVAGGRNDGFFACLRWALDGLYYSNQMRFTPCVVFPKDSLYKDNDLFSDEVNPFYYYFDATSEIDYYHISKYPIVEYCQRNALLAEKLNGGINYTVNSEYINTLAKIVKQYLHFNSSTIKILNNHLLNHQIDGLMLGVHIRGTDYKGNYRNHPKYIAPEDYYKEIDLEMEKIGYKKIYIATDDIGILDSFKNYYGLSKIVYYEDCTRNTGVTGVHTSKIKEKTPYHLGMEVLCDMYALSACGGLITGMSQVALFTRIYAKSIGHDFKTDITIDKGVNSSGKLFKVAD